MPSSNESISSLFRKPAPPRVRRSELRMLIEMIEATEGSLVRFGKAVSLHPVVTKQLLRAANSSLTGSSVEIKDATHATLFLGSRRVVYLLNTLPPEVIDEDCEDTAASA
jgi:HD-like signal output (HDOD) protein